MKDTCTHSYIPTHCFGCWLCLGVVFLPLGSAVAQVPNGPAGISALHPLARATAVAVRNDYNIPVPQLEYVSNLMVPP